MKQCPQTEIAFDLYHLVAKYGRDVPTPYAYSSRGHDA